MWVVYSLLAAFSAAVVVTLTRVGLQKVVPSVAFAIQSVLILLVAWSVVLSRGHIPTLKGIDARTWLFLVLAGIITTMSSLFSFQALKLAGAAQAGTLDKISLVFILILAAVFLRERFSWQVITGASLMVVGAILIALARNSAR